MRLKGIGKCIAGQRIIMYLLQNKIVKIYHVIVLTTDKIMQKYRK